MRSDNVSQKCEILILYEIISCFVAFLKSLIVMSSTLLITIGNF